MCVGGYTGTFFFLINKQHIAVAYSRLQAGVSQVPNQPAEGAGTGRREGRGGAATRGGSGPVPRWAQGGHGAGGPQTSPREGDPPSRLVQPPAGPRVSAGTGTGAEVKPCPQLDPFRFQSVSLQKFAIATGSLVGSGF